MQKKNKNRIFFRQLQHDFDFGIRLQWFKFLPVMVIYSIFAVSFHFSVEQSMQFHNFNQSAGFGDYLLYLFYGMDVYHPEFNEPFQIPVEWLLINLYTAFLVVSYPFKDLYGFGQQILLRSNQKRLWWYSKCMWNVCSVILCYALGILILFACAAIGGNPSVTPSREITEELLHIPYGAVSHTNWLTVILVLPALTSATLALIQMFLSLIIKPVLSYGFTICIMVVSAYYCTPFLIGNYSMFARSRLMLPEEGMDFTVSVIVEAVLSLLCIFGGAFVFHKRDILEKR